MEDKYFINGEKDGYTWRQLLYWCYTHIAGFTWKYEKIDGRRRYGYYPQNSGRDHYFMNGFFCNFRHHDNDGWWSRDRIERYVCGYNVTHVIGPLRPQDGRYKNEPIYAYKFIPKVFTPKKWQVIDNHGRVIPSGWLRQEYLKYHPSDTDQRPEIKRKQKLTKWGWKQEWLKKQGYKFRNGPVPGISSYWNKGHNWHGNAGNHGSVIRELKHREGYEQTQKETKEEFGITFKMSRRTHTVLDECHYHKRRSKGRGWKITRKEKQWM